MSISRWRVQARNIKSYQDGIFRYCPVAEFAFNVVRAQPSVRTKSAGPTVSVLLLLYRVFTGCDWVAPGLPASANCVFLDVLEHRLYLRCPGVFDHAGGLQQSFSANLSSVPFSTLAPALHDLAADGHLALCHSLLPDCRSPAHH